MTNTLTKRELIAAMAMQGMLANPDANDVFTNEKEISSASIILADALIAALSTQDTEE